MGNFFRKYKPTSVGAKIALPVAICLFAIVSISSYLEYRLSSSESRENLNDQAQITLLRISRTVAEPLWRIEKSVVKEVIRSEVQSPIIAAIRITETSTNQIFNAGESSPDFSKAISIVSEFNGVPLANIEIITDYRTVDILQRKLLIRSAIETVTILIFIVLILTFLFKRYIGAPLLTLENAMIEIEASNTLGKRLELSSPDDEIGRSAIHFNRIVSKIEQFHQQEIKNYHQLKNTLKNVTELQEQLIESEKMASLGSLVAGVAHEINTPIGIGITGVSGIQDELRQLSTSFSKNSLTKKSFENHVDFLNDSSALVFRNLVRVRELVQNFKQLSVDQSYDEIRDINLRNYLDEVMASVTLQYKNQPYSLINSIHEGIELTTYPGAISQIFTNLFLNSCIHGFLPDTPGIIEFTSELEPNNTVKIIYRDDGIGMTEKAQKMIFEPFFTTRRNKGGTGLGAHIIYNLVTHKLGGRIICRSKLNEGTTFEVTLPLKLQETSNTKNNSI